MKHIIIFLILVMAFLGCRKRYETDIVGMWQLVPFNQPDTNDVYIWEFGGADILKRYAIPNHGTEADTLENIYFISKDIRYVYVEIDTSDLHPFLPMHDEEGKYRIDYLKDGILKISRISMPGGSTEAAYLRREFKQYIPPSAKK